MSERAGTTSIDVIVEIPKGSRNKYELDHRTGRIRLDRMLFSSVHYPADYGFVEDTLAGDGDPLDALVLVEAPTFPGCLIEARPIGVFRMRDEAGEDEKILTVPVSDPNWTGIERLEQIQPHLLREIEHFFAIYKELENKKVEILGWAGVEAAHAAIADARANYAEAHKARGMEAGA